MPPRVTAVTRGGIAALVVSCPRLQIRWGLRRVVRGRVWTAGAVSRRGPPPCGFLEPDAYAAV